MVQFMIVAHRAGEGRAVAARRGLGGAGGRVTASAGR